MNMCQNSNYRFVRMCDSISDTCHVTHVDHVINQSEARIHKNWPIRGRENDTRQVTFVTGSTVTIFYLMPQSWKIKIWIGCKVSQTDLTASWCHERQSEANRWWSERFHFTHTNAYFTNFEALFWMITFLVDNKKFTKHYNFCSVMKSLWLCCIVAFLAEKQAKALDLVKI